MNPGEKKLQEQEKKDNEPGSERKDKLESFHNPFDPNDKTKVDQQSLDNEQQFKEALTERD